MIRAIPAAALALLITARAASALQLTHVQHDPAAFDPKQDETVEIAFRLSEPGVVSLRIFDGRDIEVRKITTGSLEAGDHRLTWDGKDGGGRPVPPEAYHYTLEARGRAGDLVEHDVTDLTGGKTLTARSVEWNAEAGEIRYVLPETGRVNIRVGLQDGGPLLGTVIDWVPRAAGLNAEPWNGMDASSVLALANHPKLAIRVSAFSLPDNTLLVLPPPDEVRLISGLPNVRRVVKHESPKRMYDASQQAIEQRRDVTMRLVLPADLPRGVGGNPVISGPTPIRVEVDEPDRTRMIDQRCEVMFFIDGQFAFENEVGFLPLTWTWDPEGTNPGVHHITANLIGYEGNFGAATVRVQVESGEEEE